jgi:hypothetical protein
VRTIVNEKGSQVTQESDFEKQALGSSSGFLGEFLYFLRHNKKWWLTPIIVLLLVFGLLVVIGGSGAAPFIYTLF